MPYSNFGAMDLTHQAGADLSTAQYKAVKLGSDNKILLVAAATDSIYGVLQNNPGNGGTACVRVQGETKIVLGGTVAVGARMQSANGTGVTWSAVATDCALGLCTVGGAINEIGSVLLRTERGT